MGVDGVGVGVVGSPGVGHNAPVFKGAQGIWSHGQPNPGSELPKARVAE